MRIDHVVHLVDGSVTSGAVAVEHHDRLDRVAANIVPDAVGGAIPKFRILFDYTREGVSGLDTLCRVSGVVREEVVDRASNRGR